MASIMPLSWMELALLIVLLGAFFGALAPSLARARLIALWASGLSFILSLTALVDFYYWGHFLYVQGFLRFNATPLGPLFALDFINTPILLLVSLLSFVLVAVTLKTRVRRFSFVRTLLFEACLLAFFAAVHHGVMLTLLALWIFLQIHELEIRGRSIRVLSVHMGFALVILLLGEGLLWAYPQGNPIFLGGIGLIALGIAVMAGLWPFHCWVVDLFNQASLGTSLFIFSPMLPVYLSIRMLLPYASPSVLQVIASLALLTAVYMAAMCTIQIDARRFLGYFLLSHTAMVLAGLMLSTGLGVTASLFLWLSVGLSGMTLGLIVRCIEARRGRVLLDHFHGMHGEVPTLAAFFLIAGLATVGFPGTLGFFGQEMLTDAAIQSHKIFGLLVVVSTALNGIAVLRVYALLFLGKAVETRVNLRIQPIELAAFLILVLMLLGGAVYPQAGLDLRKNAMQSILSQRQTLTQYSLYQVRERH